MRHGKAQSLDQETKAAPRAVLYARVSTGPQEKGTSIENQLAACKARADAIGAEVVAIFQDTQSGADLMSRRGMQSALEQIQKGNADTLIVYDMSRYSRDKIHQEEIKTKVLNAKGRLDFCTIELGDLSTADGSLSFDLMGLVAVHERRKTAERTKAGLLNTARAGRQPSRARRPYGYTLVNRDMVLDAEFTRDDLGRYFIREDEAEVVRNIFRWYVQGESLRGLQRRLRDAGVPAPQGGEEWHHNAIHYILQNPIYAGNATYSRHKFEHDDASTQRGEKAIVKMSLRDEAEWIKIPSPAIIDQETFERVKVLLHANKVSSRGQNQGKFLLSGFLRCPHCRAAMTGVTTGSQNKRAIECYRCRVAQAKRAYESRCECGYYNAAVLEDQVLEALREYARSPRLVRAFYNTLREAHQTAKGGETESRIKALKETLDKLNTRRDSITEAQIRAVELNVDSSVYERKLVELQNERQEVQSQLNALVTPENEKAHQAVPTLISRINKSLDNLTLVLASQEITVTIKRKLLAQVISRIEIEPKASSRDQSYKITIHFLNPFEEK